MSAEQADEIKKRFWTVVLAFDNDKAGRTATFTVSRLLGRLNLQYAHIPSYINDIQDCNKDQLEKVFHSLV
jgi:DNA primase